MLLAIDQPDASAGSIYNVGDTEVLTVGQVIEVICEELGHEMCASLGVEGADDPRVATIANRRQNRDVVADIMRRCHESANEHVRAIGLLEDSVHPAAGRLRQPRHPARFAVAALRGAGTVA